MIVAFDYPFRTHFPYSLEYAQMQPTAGTIGHTTVRSRLSWTVEFFPRFWPMVRLNSGNFGIFDFTVSIVNLDSLVGRAWKIISIDTKISMIPWKTDTKKPFSRFCVGVWVSGQPWANFFESSKDAQLDCASFDTSIITERLYFYSKNCSKTYAILVETA